MLFGGGRWVCVLRTARNSVKTSRMHQKYKPTFDRTLAAWHPRPPPPPPKAGRAGASEAAPAAVRRAVGGGCQGGGGAVTVGYTLPLRPALGVRGTVAGHRLGAREGGGYLPPLQCIPAPPPRTLRPRSSAHPPTHTMRTPSPPPTHTHQRDIRLNRRPHRRSGC